MIAVYYENLMKHKNNGQNAVFVFKAGGAYSYRTAINVGIHRKQKLKLRGCSPQANYTDRATAACRLS
jgi:hypothetical protein